jgi:hypothetical protein
VCEARPGAHLDVVVLQINEELGQLKLVLEGRLKLVPRQGFVFQGANPERVLESQSTRLYEIALD